MSRLRALLGALALSCAACRLPAQAAPATGLPPAAPGDGSEITVSVLTFGQGDPLWERFGHNALRVVDAGRGTDVAYNWGTFDFDQPNFIGRFLTGNTSYWLDSVSTPLMLEYYATRLNRTTVEQRLDLSPAQRRAVRDFVEWNVRPENRSYRYDYFADNCSTRLRDAIDRALGGQLRRQLTAASSPHTYRSEALRLVEGLPLAQAGMHVALGEPADAPLTAWEESYVPMRLRDRLRDVRLRGEDGVERPLVAAEDTLFVATRAAESARAPTLVGRFLVAGLLVAAAIVLLARRSPRGAATAIALWGLLAGLMGLVLAIAWAATRHVFWYRNENLLQLLPLALLLAAAAPLALRSERWRRRAFLLSLALLAASALGLVLKALPSFEQRNLAVLLLALPAHAAVAWSLRPRSGGGRR